jgi:hypothetical protein
MIALMVMMMIMTMATMTMERSLSGMSCHALGKLVRCKILWRDIFF